MTEIFFCRKELSGFDLISTDSYYEDEWCGMGIVSLHYRGWYFFKIYSDGIKMQEGIDDDYLDLELGCIKIVGVDEL